MVRQIPNILSVLRIILSLLLIPFLSNRTGFIVIYITVGLTDVFDGLIARKLGAESDFGAKLDSNADLLFYAILLFILLRLYASILEVAHLVALIAIIAIRLLNMLLTKLKYKRVVFIHTLANKASGVIVYLMPVVFLFSQDRVVVWVTLIIPLIAALEEVLITVIFPEPDLNRRSIFFR